jgi:hypothetical protein
MKRNVYRYRLAGACLLAGCMLSPSLLQATPPTPPVTIEAGVEEIKGTLTDGKLDYGVKFMHRNEGSKIQLQAFLMPYVVSDFKLSREPVLQESLDVREKGEVKIPIKVAKPGVYVLEVYIAGKEAENGFSNDLQRVIIVNDTQNYRIITNKQYVREERQRRERAFADSLQKNPEAPNLRLLNESTVKLPADIAERVRTDEKKPLLMARPLGPTGAMKKYTEAKSDAAWSTEDPLTIRGRLTYLDYDGVVRPLVNVSVNIYDEDVGFDDHLGTIGTDWAGNWSFSVNNDDGWLADGRDIYYTFTLENTRIRVQDCDGIDSTYRWQSATHDDLSEGTVLDFGTETGSTHLNSMRIWNILNLAWNGASTVGGRDPGFVDSCYPESDGSHWDRFWEEIHVDSGDDNAPDVVTHEYGHAVMHYAYGGDSPSPGGHHSFGDDSQNSSLAWSEGWATGFMLALRPDGHYNWNEGDTGQNIESFSDAGNRDGNRNEGRVAAAILDMIDANNDANGGNVNRGRDGADDDNTPNRVPLAIMLNNTLWGGWHDDFAEFWTSLSGELAGAQLGDANEIMYYNYMDVPAPVSCVATKVVAMESRRPETILAGLRLFRDHALKDFGGGQHLINVYYRNSPELATMLVRDSELRRDATKVINYFSKIGHTLTENKNLKKLAEAYQPLIDREQEALISSLLERIAKKASPELLADMEPLNRILKSTAGLDVLTLQKKLADCKDKHPKAQREALRQSNLNNASQKAAGSEQVRGTLEKFMPPFDR